MASEKIKKLLQGTVISNAMNKTAVVEITRKEKHPRYKKYVQKRSKYYIHDEDNSCKVGDVVSISVSRPISKLKKWKLVSIVDNK